MKMATAEELKSVEAWLTDWFLSQSNTRSVSQQSVLRETDYFAAGYLSSMEVVAFVTEIEQKFGIQFSDRDLQDQRFVTIAGLAQLIVECSSQQSESR